MLFSAIVGYKNKTEINIYNAVHNTMRDITKSQYCELEFFSLEYDQTDGDTVYNSLTTGKILVLGQ